VFLHEYLILHGHLQRHTKSIIVRFLDRIAAIARCDVLLQQMLVCMTFSYHASTNLDEVTIINIVLPNLQIKHKI